jgi:hypothetical protein
MSGDAATGDPRRWLRTWPYVVVVAVALLGSALHAARYTVLSPYDESRHIDYMARIYEDGHIVRLGDTLGDTAMRLEACRGVDVAGFTPPPCDAKSFRPRDFRDEGLNNAVNNPPLYYLVTGGVASLVKLTGISDTILDPARIMSGVWLALGLALALYAGELLGARRLPLVAVAILFALAPDPLLMGSTVNADSASVFAGALVLVAALLWERRRIGPAWVVVAGGVAAAFKMTNLIGVAIVAAWLLTRAWVHRSGDAPAEEPRSGRDYVWVAVLTVAAALFVTVAWLGIAGARATIDALDLPSNAQFYEPGFPFRAFAMSQNVFSLFPPFEGWRPAVLQTSMNQTVSIGTGLMAAAVMIAGVLGFRARDRVGTLAAWSGTFLLAAGPGFILSTWVVNRVIFQPVSRYGLSAVAAAVVVTASACRERVGTVVVWAFALLAIGTVIGTLAFG